MDYLLKYIFVLLTCFASLLFASNPKLFSSVGDPIYDNTVFIKTFSKQYAFNAYKNEFEYYILKVKKHKKIGFRLDNFPNLDETKDYQAYYLNGLKKLKYENEKIEQTIKKQLLQSIKTNNRIRFLAMIETDFPPFKTDKQLVKAIADYRAVLASRVLKQEVKQKHNAQQAAQEREDYLHSFENLKSKWIGTQKESVVNLEFIDETHLDLHIQNGQEAQVLNATYKLTNNTLAITTISITHITSKGHQHTRHKKINITYIIDSISNKKLTLKEPRKDMIVLYKLQKSIKE